jgi:hypothetical protein
MENQLTYLSLEGHTVFTSQFLKKRGTCCNTACLHCPYGFTLKKYRLQFRDVTEAEFQQVESILKENNSTVDYKSFWPENLKFVLIKEHVCGVILKNHIVIKHLLLKPHFQNQGLSKEMVESYYFI